MSFTAEPNPSVFGVLIQSDAAKLFIDSADKAKVKICCFAIERLIIHQRHSKLNSYAIL